MKIYREAIKKNPLIGGTVRVIALSSMLIAFQLVQSPAQAHDSFFTKVKEFVAGSVGFQIGSNICGLKCALPVGVLGLAVSTTSPTDLINTSKTVASAVVTGFEDWGKSFGRP